MNQSTKDEIEGSFHEVKGKIKEKAGQVTNDPDLEVKGKAEHIAGKVEKRSDRSKECSRSKLRGFCPERATSYQLHLPLHRRTRAAAR